MEQFPSKGFRRALRLLLILVLLLSVGSTLTLKAEAQTLGTLTASSDNFYGANINAGASYSTAPAGSTFQYWDGNNDNQWQTQETVIFNVNAADNSYTAGTDIVVHGTTPADGQALKNPPAGRFMFYDTDGDGNYDQGEPVFYDSDGDSLCDRNEPVLGTPLAPKDEDPMADVGEALLQITLVDADISGVGAPAPPAPNVEAVVDGTSYPLTLYQATDGSWICWIANNGSSIFPANPSAQDPTVPSPGEPDLDADDDGIADQNLNQVVNYLPLSEGKAVSIVYHDTSPAEDVSITVVYDDVKGTVSLDKSEYSLNSKVYATVNDMDLNFDPTVAEIRAEKASTTVIQWTSTSNPAAQGPSDALQETDRSSGVFETVFDMSDDQAPAPAFNESLLDVLKVLYVVDNVSASAFIPAHTGSILLDADEYMVSQAATVTVTDPDLDLDSGLAESYKGYAAGSNVAQGDRDVNLNLGGNDLTAFAASLAFDNQAGDNTFSWVSETNYDGIYEDKDGSGTVTVNDVRVAVPGYKAGSTVQQNDNDIGGNLLTFAASAVNEKFYDADGDGVFDYGEPVYNDANGNSEIDAGDVRLTTCPITFAYVKTDSMKAKSYWPFNVKLSETSTNSGEFSGKFTFTLNVASMVGGDEPRVYVSGPEMVTVTYLDVFNEVGLRVFTVDRANIVFYTGTISLDRDVYVPGLTLYVTVSDPDENADPNTAETIPQGNYAAGTAPWVTVESRYGGAILSGPYGVTCIETGADTGTFQGRVILQFTAGAAGDIPKLQVKSGATVKARYHDKMDQWGKESETLVEAKFLTSSAILTLNSDSFPPGCTLHTKGGTVRITVSDPDRNVSSASVEEYDNLLTIDVKDSNGASRTGYPLGLSMVETDADTGVFTASHTLSANARRGDLVEVAYNDQYDVAGNPRNLKAYASIITHDGVLTVDKSEVPLLTELTVTLTEPDWNFDSEQIDVIEDGAFGTSSGVDIWTTTSGTGGGIQIELVETEANSGVFTATIMPGQTIPASYGDTLTIRYNDEQGSSGNPAKIEKKVKIKAYTAEIALDKDVYACNDTMFITITDPDRNIDPGAYDSIAANEVKVKSTSWLTPVNPASALAETDVNSGVFQAEFKLQLYTGQTTAPNPGTIYVYNGDGITAVYVDPRNESGEEVEVSASAKVEFTTATVTLDSDLYTLDDTATVSIEDPDANKYPTLRDHVNVSVFSEADPAGIALMLLETSEDSGVFQGFLFFTEEGSQGSFIHVNSIDEITVRYEDETPNPVDVSGYAETGVLRPVKVEASAYFGAAPQPELPLTVSELQLLSPEGAPLISVEQGQPVQLQSEVSNTGTRDQPFLYIVQIKDSKGKVIFLNFIQGTMPTGKSIPIGIQWVPENFGVYTVEVFTWESWDKPTPLSQKAESEIHVAFKPS